MKQPKLIELVETLIKSDAADNRRLLKNFQIWNCYEKPEVGLAFHRYRFVDGPFKDLHFISTAPEVSWLNKYDNLRVIFVDNKLNGLETVSLICFDRKIEKVNPEWQPLISTSPITWSQLSVAGFRILANRTSLNPTPKDTLIQ